MDKGKVMAIGDIKALHDRAAASLLLGSIGVFALVDLNRRRVRRESQLLIIVGEG